MNGLAEIARLAPPHPGVRPKRQTIRKEWVNGRDPIPGQRCNLWIAQRTPGRVRLGTTPPITRRPIEIEGVAVWVDGERWSLGPVTKLARRDGFDTSGRLFAFIDENHGGTLSGYLYRW